MVRWWAYILIYQWSIISLGSVVLFSCGLKSHKLDIENSPNILLIVSEDHGQDLRCYGNKIVHTPNIDSLAHNGIRFVNAYTTFSVCSPSRSSIFTGLYPHQNGQIGLATHKFRMYKEFDNIPGYLKSKGYRTGCLGKIHVNPESAIPFDFHPLKKVNFGKKNLERYAAEAKNFIDAGKEPFFLMVNYPDAHFPLIREVEGLPTNVVTGDQVSETLPFVGANTERLRDVTADYYSQINRLDESIGVLLDSLRTTGKAENTFIIFISDHGAQFSRGKTTNYEAGLKIPMVFYWPEKFGDSKVIRNEMVSVIDIFPTIIEIIEAKEESQLPGRSLLHLVNNSDVKDWRKYIFADGTIGTAKYFYPKRSVRDKRFKLIHNLYFDRPDPYFSVYTDHIYSTVVSGTTHEEIKSLPPEMKKIYTTWENPPEFELYELLSDPWEFKNLAEDVKYQDDLNHLKKVLKDWRVRTRDPFADPESFARISKEVDSMNRVYPDHSYQKDSSFSWKYPEYTSSYVFQKE